MARIVHYFSESVEQQTGVFFKPLTEQLKWSVKSLFFLIDGNTNSFIFFVLS